MPKRILPRTLEDIGAEAGVSASTVSRVLNGVNVVGARARRRVLAAIGGEAGLRLARTALAGQAAVPLRRIGVVATLDVLNSAAGPFHADVLAGIEAESRALGVDLVSLPTDRAGMPDALADQAGKGRPVDAVLFLTVDAPAVLQPVLALGLPAVVVSGEAPGLMVDSVSADNFSGGYLAARHLIAHGHTRMLCITHKVRRTVRRRLDGWRKALEEEGLPLAEQRLLELDVPLQSEPAYHAAEAALRQHGGHVTAVVCANDAIGFAVLEAARQLGLAVPGDLSVIGFDDLPLAQRTTPPLSTIAVDRDAIGRRAVQRLLQRAADPTGPAEKLELGVRLVERASVAAARGKPAR
jgi:DNA-binding LacI/PurR family transcriptional regulator